MEFFERTKRGPDFFQLFRSLAGMIDREGKAAFVDSPGRGVRKRVMKINRIGAQLRQKKFFGKFLKPGVFVEPAIKKMR